MLEMHNSILVNLVKLGLLCLSVPSIGPANPYPSAITITNVAGVVNKVTVRLNGFTHNYPADVDKLLQ